ncbi:MAG: hypothetical protein V1798_08455 [Pseudomonadota bacterium]
MSKFRLPLVLAMMAFLAPGAAFAGGFFQVLPLASSFVGAPSIVGAGSNGEYLSEAQTGEKSTPIDLYADPIYRLLSSVGTINLAERLNVFAGPFATISLEYRFN